MLQVTDLNVEWKTAVVFSIECEREEDGRWLAEIPELPDVLAHDNTQDEAMPRSEILALRKLTEQLENG